MTKLIGRKALVTGGSRSTGKAIALALQEAGAEVVTSYRTAPGDGIQADLSSFEGVNQLFDEAIKQLGAIDILVNNAADYFTSSLLDIDLENYSHLLHVNVLAPLQLMQLCARQMKKGGVILNISSISGSTPSQNGLPNCTSKAALNMATRIAALELGPKGIRCNAIEPGVLDVPSNAALTDDQWKEIESKIPMRRRGTAEDISHLALFLCTEEASWINGAVLRCDGGQTLSSL